MRKSPLVASVCAIALLGGCSGSKASQPRQTVTQASDVIGQTGEDDSASEMAIATCGSGGPVVDRPLLVATSVSPITSLVGILAAGTKIQITGIIPEGTNSHTFEPPPSAAQTIAEADLVIVNGLGLEENLLQLAAANKKDSAIVCEAGTAALPKSEWAYDDSFPESAGKPNPHAWTNPTLVLRYVNSIRDALTVMDPSSMAKVDDNYVKLSTLINDLSAAMTTATDTVPVRNRQLLTYHDSFPYFARKFKYEIIGAIQPQSFSDPSAQDVAAIISQVKESGVPAIFGSEVFPSPVLEQIGKETGVKYVDSLRDDDLPGKPGSAEHSWAGLLKQDFITIVTNLGGDAAALKALNVDLGLEDKAYYPQ